MRAAGVGNPFRYLRRADDPTLLAVLLEDTIAVTGVILAATGIVMTQLTGNRLWDIGFSVIIAAMLGVAAVFLGMINMRYLTSVRDPGAEHAFQEICHLHPEAELKARCPRVFHLTVEVEGIAPSSRLDGRGAPDLDSET